MAKAEQKTDVAVIENKNALPAHLQGQRKTASVGNVDASDRIIPRIKLLQAISPEVTETEDAKAGEFWHNLAEVSLGKSLRFIPIIVRKGYTLWAPRGDSRGILARANDGIHWDIIGEWEVKLKGVKNPIKWKTAPTVAESGLGKFGSSNPEDEKSLPAATLTYQILAYFPDFPEYSPSVILNARSAVKPAQTLLNKIDMRPVNHYAQAFVMTPVQDSGAEGPYWNYRYTADGYANEQELAITEGLFNQFSETAWRPNEEDGEATEASAAAAGSVGGKAGRF